MPPQFVLHHRILVGKVRLAKPALEGPQLEVHRLHMSPKVVGRGKSFAAGPALVRFHVQMHGVGVFFQNPLGEEAPAAILAEMGHFSKVDVPHMPSSVMISGKLCPARLAREGPQVEVLRVDMPME